MTEHPDDVAALVERLEFAAALERLAAENERLVVWGRATFEAGFQERQRAERAESDLAACRAEAKSAFDLSVECRARAVKAEARYNVVRNGCRVDQFGLWAIIPDDPHGLESIKRDFDADVDAAMAKEQK